MAAITGTKLLPLRVRRYSTLGGTTPKSLRSIRPLSVSAFNSRDPNIIAKGAIFLPMEDARIASIHVGDIAEIAARVLTGAGHEGKIYPLTGPHALTMAEVAEKLSAATGNTIRYVNVPPEAARQAQLAPGMPPYLADALFETVCRAPQRQGSQGLARRCRAAGTAADLVRRIRQA